MKKALIDQILLGGMLLVIVIVFAATVSDEKAAREKVYQLKNITDTSALAAGKYFMDVNESQEEAEGISDGILDRTTLGREVKPLHTYTWDDISSPRRLTTSITGYQQSNFWYRLLDLDNFTLEASSTAILDNGETTSFVPIIVNGCTKTFNEGDEFDYLLRSYNMYDDEDNVGFYGVYESSGGQSSFAHLKNVITSFMNGNDSLYDFDENLSVSSVDSGGIANDVKQISQAFAISSFTETKMTIVEAKCGSTADNLTVERVFEVSMQGVYCGDGCDNPGINNCLLTDPDGDIFTDMDWDTSVSSCNNEDFFRINFRIDKIRERGAYLLGDE